VSAQFILENPSDSIMIKTRFCFSHDIGDATDHGSGSKFPPKIQRKTKALLVLATNMKDLATTLNALYRVCLIVRMLGFFMSHVYAILETHHDE
jgi:hypothetical protein